MSLSFSRYSFVLLLSLSPLLFGAPPDPDRVFSVESESLQAVQSLRVSTGGRLELQHSERTRAFNFVRSTEGAVLLEDDPTVAPVDRARRFLSVYGAAFGMNAAERELVQTRPRFRPMGFASGSELRVDRVFRDAIGMAHVRFDQFYQGLPVFGAQIIVHMNARGITGVNGDFVPNIYLEPVPLLSAEEAAQIALWMVAGEPRIDAPRVVRSDLSIYRVGLLEGYAGRNALAYAVDLAGADKQVWVDAETGEILNIISLRPDGLFRIVYSPEFDPDNPDLFVVRKEGDPPTNVPPFDNLYDFSGHTYNLFWQTFGRDSYDGAGIKMRTVYLVNTICPNAYWNGTTTNYCPGFDLDDVVAHEWSHAYTQFTHNLIYSYQSGALNEAYSDIWGETVDLHNSVDGVGGNNNSAPFPAGQRWLMGEDLGPVHSLLLRDMWNPARLGDPDRVSSANYACGTGDGGGVHTNSGVPNHAYAILVDGKSFNGQTVTGIGFSKSGHIYWRAQTVYQTRTTDFPGHAAALEASCNDLIGAPVTGLYGGASQTINPADCDQVKKAMLAVEMRKPPDQCKFQPLLAKNPPAPCSGSSTIFSDDFESGIGGWSATNQRTGDSPTPYYNWELRSSLPESRAGSAAFAVNSVTGTCAPGGDESGRYSLSSSSVIVIPGGANTVHLRFDHFVATELGFDGGNVRLSVNGSDYFLVPQQNYIYNAPNSPTNGPPPVGNNTNPKAGEFAWHGADGGKTTGSWGTTVVDLSSLVDPGDSVRIQFDFGIDGCNGNEGWYVDSVRLYSCPTLAAPTLSLGSDYSEPDPDGDYTLNWTRPAGATGPDTVQESTNSCGPAMSDNAESGMGNWNLSSTDSTLLLMPHWTTSSDKPNHSSSAFKAKAAEGALNHSAIMTWKSAIKIPSSGTTFLTFSDWFMNEGDDSGVVEGSVDGVNWTVVYTIGRSALLPDATVAFNNEPLAPKQVDLSEFGGQTIQLRFRYNVGPDNRAGSTPFGWYVDNIAINSESWTDIATVSGTSYKVTNRTDGRYCYRVRTTYPSGASPYSNIVTANVSRTGGAQKADLKVTNIKTTNNKAREGDKVTITATVSNTGTAAASPSKTEFLLDNTTVLGLVDTPTISAGGSADVSVLWDTRSAKGQHVIKVTADKTTVVSELNETNNSSTLLVTVKGNKVTNGSFEEGSGSAPQGWSGQDTGAGTTSWSNGGSHGKRSVAISGKGGSVVVDGAPAWTSEPIGVTDGQALTLIASIQTSGASSSPSVSLDFLGAAGNLISTLNMLTAPLNTGGFVRLEQSTTVPKGATRVQIRLVGFALTDIATAGTVKFDDIGLY